MSALASPRNGPVTVFFEEITDTPQQAAEFAAEDAHIATLNKTMAGSALSDSDDDSEDDESPNSNIASQNIVEIDVASGAVSKHGVAKKKRNKKKKSKSTAAPALNPSQLLTALTTSKGGGLTSKSRCLATTASFPSLPRSGATLTALDDTLIALGGASRDGVFYPLLPLTFTPPTKKWSTPTPAPANPPTPRSGHTATALAKSLYVFGGLSLGADNMAVFHNDLYSFTNNPPTFTQIPATGTTPRPRNSHAACAVTISGVSHLAVLGGANDSQTFGDLHFYNPVTNVWSVETKPTFKSREMHAMVAIGGNVYVSGGRHTETGEVLLDLWCYEVASKTWKELATPPDPRCCTAFAALGGRIVVFGGFNGTDTLHDDLQVYDVETNVWTVVAVDGAPSVRFGCAGVTVGEKFVVFGGSCQEGEVADVHALGVYDDN